MKVSHSQYRLITARVTSHTKSSNCSYGDTALPLELRNLSAAKLKVKVKVTLWLTVSQLVSLGVLLLFGSYGLVFVGRPLWREDGSVFCIRCWPLPAQSFLGPSPLGLETIFYCLSLFVASYDSQGHGGSIRPRLHTRLKFHSRILLYPLARTTHRKHSLSIVVCRKPHRKHESHTRLRVHWSVTSTARGEDDIENTDSSIVACWTAFTELLPSNALINSVTIFSREWVTI
jgi:hypothetical protein